MDGWKPALLASASTLSLVGSEEVTVSVTVRPGSESSRNW